MKYIRTDGVGFILWPDTQKLWHKHVARAAGAPVLSAGFVEIKDGEVRCFGRSESLMIDSRPEDSQELAQQLFGQKG